MAVKTGGHLLLKILKDKGVEFLFGTTGAGMPDIQDAMVVVKPPKWIQGLHESVTVSAATGYALASEGAGVALIDRIVGTLNAAGAIYPAFLNSAPLVILASANVAGVSLPREGVEYHYHSNQVHPISPWIKWSTQNESLQTIAEDLEKTFYMALSEHQGPTYLALRQDLMAKSLSSARLPEKGSLRIAPRTPDERTLERILDEILSHAAPQLITAQAGRHKSNVGALLRFAHSLSIAVGETRFFMNYPITDDLHVGFVDSYVRPHLLPETDLVIALEFGLLPHKRFAEHLDVIDLSSDPFHRQDVSAGGDYGGSLFPAKIRAICDAGPALDRLAKLAQKRVTRSDRERFRERYERVKAGHDKMIRNWRTKGRKSHSGGLLDGWAIGHAINKVWRRSTILVDGSMSLWEILVSTIELSEPGTYFGNPSSHLGVAAGMAYGVALARRRYTDITDLGGHTVGKISKSAHEVVCTLGDGDAIFGNIDSALWSCKHYGIGVLYLILNNACWGIEWPAIANSSQHWSRDSGDFEVVDIDRPRIDFVRIAEAFQVFARRASTPGELDLCLLEAMKVVRSDQPALLDVWMPKYTGERQSVVP